MSILPPETPWFVWAIALFHALVYPNLAFLFSRTRADEDRNLLIDCFAYGSCCALWGFNPTLVVLFAAGTLMTALAANGVRYFFRAAGVMTVGGLLIGALNQFSFRPEISPLALSIGYLGITLYSWSLGYLTYRINVLLVKTQTRLARQNSTLAKQSELMQAVNANLSLDQVMSHAIAAFQELCPADETFITLLDKKREQVSFHRSWGTAFSEKERELIEGRCFSTTADRDSFLVAPLLANKPRIIQNITPDVLERTASVDRRLFAERPSQSLVHFPFSIGGQVIGGVGFINFSDPLKLDEATVSTIASYVLLVGAAINNARLYEAATAAQQRAEASEEAMGNFLANMSHEIRTPMTAVLGYAEELQNRRLSQSERDRFTTTIIRSGKHLMGVINDILDLSKIEANKLELEKLPCSLALIIEELASSFGRQARQKGLTFSITPQFPLPAFFVSDPTRLKQVLFNLLSNAIKFTAHGGIHINIAYRRDVHQLQFDVTDTGIGMSESQRAAVFDPYMQADRSTHRQFGGTGLGLSISKHLANLLGGDLTVQGRTPVGSVFQLRIDVGDVSDEQFAMSADDFALLSDSTPRHEVHTPQLRGTVLVADDNDDTLELAQRMLQEAGLTVVTASSGQDALAMIASHHPDLVLMDIQMPQMNGNEALQALRNTDDHTPVLALTANVMAHQREHYFSQGFQGCISKPIDRVQLILTLSNYLPTAYDLQGSVLIAEDNPVNQRLIERQVQQFGDALRIITVSDGNAACAALRTQTFEVVLLDIEMPGMSGIEVLKWLREQQNTTPVYTLTGHTQLADKRLSIDAGATGHLSKPVDRMALGRLLRQHLREKSNTLPPSS